MKKIFVLTAISVLVAATGFAADISSGATGTLVFPTGAYEIHAANETTATATEDTTLIARSSTGVGVGWNTDVNGYSIMTQHKSGTKAYGSSFDSTVVYQTTSDNVDPGTVIYADGVLSATDTTDFSGTDWKAL